MDDEEAIVYVFRRYLERAGFQVTAATNPVAAVAAAGAGAFDLLVTDYRMPGLSGSELVARLRVANPGLPALVVTAYGAEVALAEANVRVMNKPLSPADLVEAVRQALVQAVAP
ncbi:response regulator [Massilia consociata]|uniref:response regulator n=1 Tax=Massilia consociata TaxID=760117 RepID=UPI0036D20F42